MASDQLAQLAARWRTAEQQLYPSLLADEHRYEHVVNVVGELVEQLSPYESEDALVAAYEDRGVLLERVSERLVGDAAGVDPELVAGAAFRLRLDTIRSEERWRQAGASITAAREGGGGRWAELFVRGPAEPSTGAASERLVAYVPAGPGSTVPALHTWVTPDPDTGGMRYGVAVLSVDVTTERPRPHPEPLAGPEEFGTEQEWQSAVERLGSWACTTDDARAVPTAPGR